MIVRSTIAARSCGPRFLSSFSHVDAAKEVLGIHGDVTSKQLRLAYLQAAKECHPDLVKKNKNDAVDFRKVTDAYELLSTGVVPDADLGITVQEDASFRAACKEWLGVKAETVEESKRCPIFRQWLEGGTDSAFRWKVFFALHGGLAPMLRPPTALLEGQAEPRGLTRRRRKIPTQNL